VTRRCCWWLRRRLPPLRAGRPGLGGPRVRRGRADDHFAPIQNRPGRAGKKDRHPPRPPGRALSG
jgi:hypothetical protein